jgi:hypothetical protein
VEPLVIEAADASHGEKYPEQKEARINEQKERTPPTAKLETPVKQHK